MLRDGLNGPPFLQKQGWTPKKIHVVPKNKKQNRNIAIINETKHHYTHLLDGDEEGKRKGVRRGSDGGAAEERRRSSGGAAPKIDQKPNDFYVILKSSGRAAEERRRSREGAEEERTPKIAYAYIIQRDIYYRYLQLNSNYIYRTSK